MAVRTLALSGARASLVQEEGNPGPLVGGSRALLVALPTSRRPQLSGGVRAGAAPTRGPEGTRVPTVRPAAALQRDVAEIQIVLIGIVETHADDVDNQVHDLSGLLDDAVHLGEGGRLAHGDGLDQHLELVAVLGDVVSDRHQGSFVLARRHVVGEQADHLVQQVGLLREELGQSEEVLRGLYPSGGQL